MSSLTRPDTLVVSTVCRLFEKFKPPEALAQGARLHVFRPVLAKKYSENGSIFSDLFSN